MKKLFIGFLLVVVVVVSAFMYVAERKKNGLPPFESVKVGRGEVANFVSVTGHVEPVMRINLSFPYGGVLAMLPVREGEEVSQGTLLASLSGGVLRSTLSEAEAHVARERALLQGVLAPLRTEEKALKDASVLSAETALSRSEGSARTTLSRTFVSVDDVMHEGVDELFTGTQSGRPELGVDFTYGTTEYALRADPEVKRELSAKRADIETILDVMEVRANDPSVPIEEALTKTAQDLVVIEDFLTALAEVINKYKPTGTAEQSVYETFQLSVSTARATVNATRLEVASAYSAYTSALSALSVALRDLDLAVAGASGETIRAQEASLELAERSLETVRERIREVEIRAPVKGIVSRIDGTVGETVGPYAPILELMTEGVFEVETFIPEADIANVKIGDTAEITFDAFDKQTIFHAEVVRIALTETVKEGVPTYKTTLRLLDTNGYGDMTLRSGMTADIEILTDSKRDVLYVPLRSVLKEGTRTYVKVFDGAGFSERDITTGLRGSDGTIEVVSGLTEGEEVVLYVEEEA